MNLLNKKGINMYGYAYTFVCVCLSSENHECEKFFLLMQILIKYKRIKNILVKYILMKCIFISYSIVYSFNITVMRYYLKIKKKFGNTEHTKYGTQKFDA